jgi:hypothetical protein
MQYIFQDLFYLFFNNANINNLLRTLSVSVARHEAVPLFSPEPDDICKGG